MADINRAHQCSSLKLIDEIHLALTSKQGVCILCIHSTQGVYYVSGGKKAFMNNFMCVYECVCAHCPHCEGAYMM